MLSGDVEVPRFHGPAVPATRRVLDSILHQGRGKSDGPGISIYPGFSVIEDIKYDIAGNVHAGSLEEAQTGLVYLSSSASLQGRNDPCKVVICASRDKRLLQNYVYQLVVLE